MRCLRALDFLPEILVQIAIRKQIKKNDGTYLTYRWMGTARELLFMCYNLSMTKRVLYFMMGEWHQNIKIGYSTNFESRASTFTTYGPHTCLGTVSGERSLERWLHYHLRASRLHGEWFAPSEEVLTVISRIQDRTFHAWVDQVKQAEKARLLKRAQQVDQASGRTPGRITLATLKRQLQDPDGDAKLAAWMERSDERSRTTQQHLSDVPRNQQPIVLTDYWCERHQRVH